MVKFKYFSQITISFTIIIFSIISLNATDRAVWVTAWDVNSPEKIDKMVVKMNQYGFNKIFIQTRYRGDALYKPNCVDSTFENLDPRCYLLKNSEFDPLDYTIKKAKPYGIGVYAWVTTFVVTPYDLRKLDSNHIFYRHPEWLLKDKNDKPMNHNEYEGAFLDPSLPEVRQYTLNILADIVTNYDISGIQLDYIRYPDTMWGWNTESKKLAETNLDFNFALWKQQKISSFMNVSYITLKNIKPQIEISASVISLMSKAKNSYSQLWWKWIEEGYADRVYVMAYNTSNKTFIDVIKQYKSLAQKDKITVILRSYQEANEPYSASQINSKLGIAKAAGFKNLGFYSYAGLISEKYLDHIKF